MKTSRLKRLIPAETRAGGKGGSFLLGVVILAFAASIAAGQSITGLGSVDWPEGGYTVVNGISRDGSTVVGVGYRQSATRYAARWTRAEGWQLLGSPSRMHSTAYAANQDGSVIVGQRPLGDEDEFPRMAACIWMSDGAVRYLPALDPAFYNSVAYGVSDDGAVVVGYGGPSGNEYHHAFRWTSAEGTVDLGLFPGGIYAGAFGLSRDGAVIVGACTGDYPGGAFRWTSDEGMVNIGTLPGASVSLARAVSSDGSVIVGEAASGIGSRAFRWTSAGGMEDLGLTAAARGSVALAVNADGSIVVGYNYSWSFNSSAFLWNRHLGMVDLNTYLPSIGIDLTGWTLLEAVGISADGLAIVGNGEHDHSLEGWIISLPRCAPDFNRDFVVDSQDFFDLLNAYFQEAPSADFNEDGVVNSADVFDFLASFFAGCP
jgi:probable HAF family extracellular repeat protein